MSVCSETPKLRGVWRTLRQTASDTNSCLNVSSFTECMQSSFKAIPELFSCFSWRFHVGFNKNVAKQVEDEDDSGLVSTESVFLSQQDLNEFLNLEDAPQGTRLTSL
eukprot:761016-Hanusia_phi.AAC.1